ncbi:hypothetical protein M5689_020468 [Euphorbia peplus]|nr:hypothetical protein M5689_020468 [Euphorbia peplus]
MKILSWNVQGLGNPGTVQTLARLLSQHCPDLVFIMESRLNHHSINEVKRRFHDYNTYFVPAVGRSGGLTLLWNKMCNINILGFLDHCIHFCFCNSVGTPLWRDIGVYGWPESTNKFRTWFMLKELHLRETLPWVCFGDFNEIMYSSEKYGGRCANDSMLNAFRSCLFECDLFDMGYEGALFTWDNGRAGDDNIRERMDRFVRTVEWDVMFPNSKVQHLARISSDHAPILLDSEGVRKLSPNHQFIPKNKIARTK